MSQRRSTLPRHGRRALVATGLTAAIVLVPAGMAQALPDPTDPAGAGAEVVGGLTGGDTTLPVPVPVPVPGGTGTDGGETDGEATDDGGTEDGGTESPFVVPQELKAAFAQAGFSAECVDGVSAGFEQLGAGLAGLADLEELTAELEAALAELAAADPAALPGLLEDLLTGFVPAEGEAAPGPSEDIIGGLELILATLSEECVPTPPTGGGTETPKPTTPVATPTQQPPAATPTPQAPAPVAAPVAYLGYAPTGADTARADDASVPLAAVAGGLVLLAGAGAAGYGMRGRAASPRD